MAQSHAERSQQRAEQYQQRVLADIDEGHDNSKALRPNFEELSLRGRPLGRALVERHHPQDPLGIDPQDPDEAYHQ